MDRLNCRRLLALSSLSMLLVLFLSLEAFGNAAKVHYDKAMGHKKQGDFQVAVNSFKEAIKLRPNYPYAYHNLAHVYEELGELEQAMEAFDHAISLDPTETEHFSCRGKLYYKMGKYQDAITDFNSAIRLKHDFAWAYHQLAHVYEKTGEYEKAKYCFEQAVAIEPDEENHRTCYESLMDLLDSIAKGVPEEVKEEHYYKPPEIKGFSEIFGGYWRKRTGGEERSPFNKSYALLIGISDYGHLKDLYSPEKDVQKMREFLQDNSRFDEIVSLTNEEATFKTILYYMEDYFPRKVKKEDRFLFYFSGHGVTRLTDEGKKGYLPLANEEIGYYSRSISMQSIYGWAENFEANHYLFILDSCFSGLAGLEYKSVGDTYDSTIDSDILKILCRSRGRHLLVAGTEEQESIAGEDWEGSLFTDAIITGLGGVADNGDGIITIKELYPWLRTSVMNEANKRGRRLTPLLWDLGKYSSEGEFLFIVPSEE